MKLVCGEFHTLALTDDGAVYACGNNAYGQLGDGTITYRSTFTKMIGVGASGCSGIDAGRFHSIILKNGTAYTCGWNFYGQLGLGYWMGASVLTLTPMVGVGASGCTTVAAEWLSSFVLKSGVAYGCGNNGHGQLGTGNYTNYNSLTAMVGQGTSGCTAISAGNLHTVVLKTATAYATGSNQYGQIGDNTVTERTSLTAMIGQGTSGCSAISAGTYHTVVLKSGVVYACGGNATGQLGDNTAVDKHVLTAMVGQGASGCSGISAGGRHTLVLKNGAAYSTGWNSYGQLGDNTTTTRYQLISMLGFGTSLCSLVAAGVDYSGVLRGYRAYACGFNTDGQLGDGTTTNRWTLVACTPPV